MGMQLLGTGCVLLLTSRWFVLAVPPIALAYNRIHIYFTHASREVQHLAGAAEFRNVAMRYRNSIPPSLKEVSFVIEAGWRVGVCGRTGAGKSSVLAALLRLADDMDGSVLIEGVDTATLPLATLRSSLSLIQQESTLIRGTIRSNLIPMAKLADEELLSALRAVGLESAVVQAGGLGARVEERDHGFPAGQRQLLGIVRLLLRRSRVVLLDEATSSCDSRTDALVQEAIAKHCQGCTVITIAHRIGTIADSNRIMVLEAGRVVEFGTPADLRADAGGLYAKLLRDSTES